MNVPAPLLEIRDLSCTLSDRPILRNVSLDVHEGETIVLLGRSGSGKTTLLRSVNALIPPSSGEIRFEGRPAARTILPFSRSLITGIAMYLRICSRSLASAIRSCAATGPGTCTCTEASRFAELALAPAKKRAALPIRRHADTARKAKRIPFILPCDSRRSKKLPAVNPPFESAAFPWAELPEPGRGAS